MSYRLKPLVSVPPDINVPVQRWGTIPLPFAVENYVLEATGPLPAHADLRHLFGPIENQGGTGACTAYATLQWYAALRVQAGHRWHQYSEMAQYAEELRLQGSPAGKDAGSFTNTGIDILEHFGVMPQSADPTTPTGWQQAPPAAWIKDSRLIARQVADIAPDKQGRYHTGAKDAVAAGHPVVFAFVCFSEIFDVGSDGYLPMPAHPNQPQGGHDNVLVGYDDTITIGGHTGAFLVRNQWGTAWGMQGYYWMLYDYFDAYLQGGAFVGFPPNAIPAYTITASGVPTTATCGDVVVLTFHLSQPGGKPGAHGLVDCTIDGARTRHVADAQGVLRLPLSATTPQTMTITAVWTDPTGWRDTWSHTLQWQTAHSTPASTTIKGATLQQLATAPNGTYGTDHTPYQVMARRILGDQKLYAEFAALVHRPPEYWATSAQDAKTLAGLGVQG